MSFCHLVLILSLLSSFEGVICIHSVYSEWLLFISFDTWFLYQARKAC